MMVMRIFILMSLVCGSWLFCGAQEATDSVPIDTVYVYHSWESILTHQPDAAYSGPIVYHNNELEIRVFAPDAHTDSIINVNSVAVCVGDTLWMLNTAYLYQNFDVKFDWFDHFIPLYFTDKIAFVKFWNQYPDDYYIRPMPYNQFERVWLYDCKASFYLLDFVDRRVLQLNQKVLSSLLLRYPDLHRRYTGMKKNKDPEVVDYFFLKYIDRLKTDDEALTLLEQIYTP